MLGLYFVLVVLFLVLTAVLWLMSQSLQSYLYTEPNGGFFWRAPAAAAVLTAFFWFWAMLNIWGSEATPTGVAIPYGVLWEFSNRIDVIAEPVPQFESKRRTSEQEVFKLDKGLAGRVRYKRVDSDAVWDAAGVEWVKFTHNGQHYDFRPDAERQDDYVVFVDANSGLEMREFEIGRVGYYSVSRVLVYFLLNVAHLGVWLACFWPLLRFYFWHAIGLAFAMWLLFTVTILQGVFERAAGVV
ncbi:MAG TPA: hypothetical protein VE988_00930 [Gemmataceae bacterium]|nr:hypothetical protein [Gemmataceae bacterium]